MAEEWRLRDEQGSVRSLTTQELRDGLARGMIPSSALVSRPGGKDFTPAFSVPELATAAIRAKRTPSIPPGASGWLAKPATSGKPTPEVPAAPRSRRRIAHTLVGIQGDEDEAPAPGSLGAPIVAPGAGGSPQGAPRAITQVPRYTPSPVSSTPASDDVVIPRAPRAPGPTTLSVTDQGWEDPGGPGENASIFDGEEDAQTLVKPSEPPKRTPPKPPGRPPAPSIGAKAGDVPKRPSQQPPPLPKREPGKPPARPTVMGLGTGGARIQPPRAPLKSGSTPPPPPARPVSKPPPAPPLKRTPQPPTAATKPIVDEATIPIADENTDVTPPPDAALAATAKGAAAATTSPKPPAAATSPKPPATTSAKPPATSSAKPPAVAPVPSTQETLTGGLAAPASELAAQAIAAGAAASPGAAVEGTPTVPMPEAREGKASAEGTPTVPMPEVRASVADVDEAPTSKMAVQIVHGAALAMRAALAAPKHEAPGASSSSPPEAVPPAAMPPVSAAPVSPTVSAAPVSPTTSSGPRPSPPPSSLAPAVATRSAAADLESALASGSASAKLPRPPRTPRESDSTSGRDSGPLARESASSSTPLMGSTPPPAANDEEAAPQSGVEVPVSSLFAASGVWIAGLVLVFFVGRCSAIEARPPAARSAVGTAARLAFLRASPGSAGGGAELRACNVSRRPTRWAAAASKNVPFEMAPAAGGAAMFVGYGAGDDGAVGLKVDPKTGKFDKIFDEKVAGGVSRVTPLPGGSPDDVATFFATPKADTTLVPVAGARPEVWVRFGESGVESLPARDGTPTMAFPFQAGERTNAEQVLATSAGVFLSFRRGEAIMGGWLDGSGKPKGDLATVVGSGGKVGKPRASWNGKEVAVTFADKPEGSPWQVRVGHAAAGAVPSSTKAFDLPAGGPGGDAIAPDIVGLPDGRWILMWTEGAAGNRAIQSITLGPDFAPIGDAIALSPPSGNFGQAQLGVVGRYVTVLFLQKGDEDFELWGAVLQCG